MSMAIARSTQRLALEAVGQFAEARRKAREAEVALLKKVMVTEQVTADLLIQTIENLGQLIDTRA